MTNLNMATGIAILTFLCIFVGFLPQNTEAVCNIPEWFVGDWFSMEDGRSITTIINRDRWGESTCQDIFMSNDTVDASGARNSKILVQINTCFHCIDAMWRTPNVLQYRMSVQCVDLNAAPALWSVCFQHWPSWDTLYTLFRIEPKNVNCKATFQGVYQYSYEIDWGGGGICNNQDSKVVACQEPGSPYIDNEVFIMNFAKCIDVANSRNERIRYQCLGSWLVENDYMLAAVADTVQKDNRERFKCLLTLRNQRPTNNKYRWTMSRFADCLPLKSTYIGDIRLVIQPVPPVTPYSVPSCNLPRNISGMWFTVGEHDSDVQINDTHIYFKTQIDQYTYLESYYACQQTLGTRFLMTRVTVGQCEVDYLCFDILPRHHSIVRYRIGKPSRLTAEELDEPDYLNRKFRQACNWQQFTFNRDNFDWKYRALIMNPPSPVPCPIAGRYKFIQKADNPQEKYVTRIRGITVRPRVQVNCRLIDSEFKSCTRDMSKLEVDAEYCETVDYSGRPIGEYDVPDHYLTCVGYWMEDMRSYLITYDEEDAISKFRCWVYERMSWTSVAMSRSMRAACGPSQTAFSHTLDQGAGLALELHENERLFDECPLRYDTGADPYKKTMTIYVLSAATAVIPVYASALVCLLSVLHQLL